MKKPNKQHNARAATFKRIAKALRVRSRNYDRISRQAGRDGKSQAREFYAFRADILKEFAEEFDAEAALLRSMR